ncbi:MAG: NAD-binding protein [Armatimonadetes bacterium]|nr:NAD-binding protein [Armatimonadota bacterium]
MKRKMKRYVLAQIRDFRILVWEFKWSIVAFVLVNLFGAFLFSRYYTKEPLSFSKAFYATFNMIFFQATLEYPTQWYVQIFFYLIPLLGLGLVVEGFVRFGALIFNKRMRGEAWQTVVASTFHDHTVLCGLGTVGFRIAEELLRLDHEFVVIEQKEQKFVEEIRSKGIPVLIGDAKSEALLQSANVESAKAIIVATDNDLANLETALNAKELNPEIRIVMRMFDATLARKVQKAFGIHMAFSTSSLSAPHVVTACLEESVIHSFYVGEHLLSVAEHSISPQSPHVGETIASFEKELNLSVIGHRRNGQVNLYPDPDVVLGAGESLVVVSSLSELKHLR